MTFKSLAGALGALLVVFAFAPGANAAIDDGIIALSEDLDFNLGNLGTPANPAIGPQAVGSNGNFLHDYFFTLTDANSDFSASIDVDAANANWVSATTFRLQVFAVSDLENPILPIEVKSGNNISVAVSGLAAGDYVLRFLGTRAGANGVSYNGNVAVVPLPPAALLLASALATLFLFGRMRRRTQVA